MTAEEASIPRWPPPYLAYPCPQVCLHRRPACAHLRREDCPSLMMLAVVPGAPSLGLLNRRQVELGHLDQIRAIFALAPLS